MKNNIVFILISCLVAAGISACKAPTSGSSAVPIPESTTGTPAGTTAQAQPKQGTGDSGGGNLYKGIPLEDYKKNPNDLKATKIYILPIIDFLAPTISDSLRSVLTAKNWYFVSGPLTDLPKEKIGSAVPAEQGALQDFRQVWIDSDLFNKMNDQDKAQLVLHELLMGIKLLKLMSPQQACLQSEIDKMRSTLIGSTADLQACRSLSDAPNGNISDLTVLDYAQIRELASALIQRIVPIEATSSHAERWWRNTSGDIAKSDQYIRSFNANVNWADQFDAGNFSFQQTYIARDQKSVSHDETLKMARNSFDAGYKLTNGYEITELDHAFPLWHREDGFAAVENIWKPTSTCNVNLKHINGPEYEITFSIGSFSKFYSINLDDESPKNLSDKYFWFNSEVFEKRILIQKPNGAKDSQKVEKLVGYFDKMNRLRFVEASEIFWNGSFSGNKIDGLLLSDKPTWKDNYLKGYYYLCGVDSSLQLTNKKVK